MTVRALEVCDGTDMHGQDRLGLPERTRQRLTCNWPSSFSPHGKATRAQAMNETEDEMCWMVAERA